MELSFLGAKWPGNFSSLELSHSKVFAPWKTRSPELSFTVGLHYLWHSLILMIWRLCGTYRPARVVLLRIPNPQPNFTWVLPNLNPSIFFAAVSDGFGSSVCESIFSYQVAVFKRHCIAVAVGRRHRFIGGGRRREGCAWAVALWSLELWAAGGTTLSTSYRQGSAQRAWCMLRINPNRR